MHIHNAQHNQNIFDHFQTYTVIYYGHSELSRKEKSKFEFKEKKFCLLLKVAFPRKKRLQTSLFSNKLNLFYLEFKFWFFFARQLRMTIIDCCISLKMIKKNLVVLGGVDMRQLLSKQKTIIQSNFFSYKSFIIDTIFAT